VIGAIRRLLRPPATAVVIPVPEASHVADGGEPGMPPHVTVMWPFARRVRGRHRRGLAALAAGQEAFGFTLARIGTFPGVVYLAPEPAAPFVEIVRAITAAWPRFQPYGGAYPDVVPHVTVRRGDPPGDDEQASLQTELPIACVAREIVVLAPDGEAWREVYRVALRDSTSA
jgi:hypothetical protein